MMRRREFMTAFAGATGAMILPRGVGAQNRPTFLRVGTASPTPRTMSFLLAFETRLQELGYVEGKNFELDYRYMEGQVDRFDAAMKELVRRDVDIIVAFGPEVALKSALAATRTIPIVMVAIDYDPIALGYVSGLARPTGNVTGLFLDQLDLAAKRLQLLKDALSDRNAATVFWDQPSADQWNVTQSTAAKLGLRLAGVELRDYPYDYDRALAPVAPEHRGALIAMTSPLFGRDRERLAAFALRHRMASMFVFREYVDLGGLMSYGPNRNAMSRRTADYVNRLARGAKPTDLPIERPTTFELVINLKTAKALGLEFSPAILLRADELIE
jgi:putative tryptophan/tyrosine transport system substrate-binding protein